MGSEHAVVRRGLNYLLTYLLTPWSRVLLEKLSGSAASQELPRIFGTWRFITVLTSACHLSLSWANFIQSLQPPPTSWRSILILSSHLRLGLSNGLFPAGFPTRTLCTPLPSPIRATCTAHLILLDFTARTIFGKAKAGTTSSFIVREFNSAFVPEVRSFSAMAFEIVCECLKIKVYLMNQRW